jgi:hypothetical protein
METAPITATSGPACFDEGPAMATILNIHEGLEPRHHVDSAASVEEAAPLESRQASDDSNGYIDFLDEPKVLEALDRAKRENPGSLIYLEPLGSDLWSLQVYRSEAAKEAFRLRFFYQHMALASLGRRRNGEHAKNT